MGVSFESRIFPSSDLANLSPTIVFLERVPLCSIAGKRRGEAGVSISCFGVVL
jgi:hypothetical protein